LTQLQGRGTRHLSTEPVKFASMQGSQRTSATMPLGALSLKEKGPLQVCGYSKRKSLDPEPRGP